MRARTVLNALFAAAAFAWQPDCVHDCHERAAVVYAQFLSAVGTPCASRHGTGRMRWPVAWKTNEPVSLSFTVNFVTWHPAHSRGFFSVACDPKVRAVS